MLLDLPEGASFDRFVIREDQSQVRQSLPFLFT
jgi:hypothetical protein